MTGPVSISPVHAVQVAIIDLLRGDDDLGALVTGVFDNVPEEQPFDYVRVGDHLSIPDNAHGAFGRELTETIHIWTRARGNRNGQAIADRITQLLDHRPGDLEVDGHTVVSIRSEFDQALTDPDHNVRHHIIRFRIITAHTDEQS